jgi:hypothetical protein
MRRRAGGRAPTRRFSGSILTTAPWRGWKTLRIRVEVLAWQVGMHPGRCQPYTTVAWSGRNNRWASIVRLLCDGLACDTRRRTSGRSRAAAKSTSSNGYMVADGRRQWSADGSSGRIQCPNNGLTTDDGAPAVTAARPSHVLRLVWMQGRGSFISQVTLTA